MSAIGSVIRQEITNVIQGVLVLVGGARQAVTDWRAARDLARRVRKVRIEAYNVLSKFWCSGDLIRPDEGKYVYDPAKGIDVWIDAEPDTYNVCLEGGILLAAGWPAEELYKFSSAFRVASIDAIVETVQQNQEHTVFDPGEYEPSVVYPADRLPEGFDFEAAVAAQAQMRAEIEGEARFRALVEWQKQRQQLGYDDYVPGTFSLVMVNDDDRLGREVVLEIVRDALFDSPDDEIVEKTNEAIADLAEAYDLEVADASV